MKRNASTPLGDGKPPWYRFRNLKGDGPVEIEIGDEIGMWGVRAADFSKELRLAGERDLVVGINSPGGDVTEGWAVYNALKRYPGSVTTRVDGMAASIASVILMAGDRIVAADPSLVMIHDPWGFVMGTSEDMTKTAEVLDKMKDEIVDVYALRTNQARETIAEMMAAERWMSPQEAMEEGFVDAVSGSEPKPVKDSWDLEAYGFKNAPMGVGAVLGTRNAANAARTENTMTKTKEPGTVVPDNDPAKDAVQDKTDTKVADLRNELQKLKEENERNRRERAESLVDNAVADGSITVESKGGWVDLAVKDYASAKAMIEGIRKPAGGDPIPTGASDAGNVLDELSCKGGFNAQLRYYRANRADVWNAARHRFKNANTLGGMWVKILSMETVDYLGATFAPLNAVSKNFLPSGASGGDGVITRIASAITPQAITAGYAPKDVTSTAVTVTFTVNNTVPIGIDDVENAFIGGPSMFRDTFIQPMVEGLSVPIWAAIWALVTKADYPTQIVSTSANFDADDLADASAALSKNKAPRTNRSAILAPDFYVGVGKQSVVSDASAYGSTDPIRELVVPRARGFSMYEVTGAIPDNGENLGSVCLHQSAMAAAARVPLNPNQPGGTVNNVVDPVSQLPLQFRAWYDWTAGKHIFSVANLFGVAKANGNALVRIATA